MAKDTDTGGTDLAAGTNGTEAAEISHQHGYHLGELIFRKSPGIRKIHFIAHSAGAWAARAAARYLSQASTNPPEIQITLLDPFIPAELTDGKDTALSKGVMDNLFDSNEGVKSLVIADNYTLIETGWDWVPGTNELFNWPEDVSFAVWAQWRWGDCISGVPATWKEKHSGPIHFYADTVEDPNRADARHGWRISLEYAELTAIGTDKPIVTMLTPADGATVVNGTMKTDVTFSKPVSGVHAADLKLSGDAFQGVTVGTPTLIGNGLTWRFPLSNITKNGYLVLGIGGEASDISDQLGQKAVQKAWSYTVRVQASPSNDISIAGYNWIDNGNDNGVLETGESIGLQVKLRNNATVEITNVQSILRCPSSGNMKIDNAELDYPALGVGESELPYNRHHLFLDLSTDTTVNFMLHVMYEKNGISYYQDLPFSQDFYELGLLNASIVLVPPLEIDDSTTVASYNNGDGIIQSGESVHIRPRLRNIGQATATDIDAWLTYDGAAFKVDGLSDVHGYPDLAPNHDAQSNYSTVYNVADIQRSYSGTEYIDMHVTYDQNPADTAPPVRVPVTIVATAWLRLSEQSYDFGVASPGTLVSHTIQIKNVGSAPFTVDSGDIITSSPTDTTFSGVTFPCSIGVGQTVDLVVQINTTGLKGQIPPRWVRVKSTGRVRWPGEDDVFTITGLVSDAVPVFQVPNVTGAKHPDISGNWIVWRDSRNGNEDIFAYNLATGQARAICTDPADQRNPFVSGTLVVWEDDRNRSGNDNTDIYAYDLSRPDLGVFPVANATPWREYLIGLDGNLVAFTRAYEILSSDSTPKSAMNLVVMEYNGNGGFTERYSTTHAPGSGTADRPTIEANGDFTEGFLIYKSDTYYWNVSSSGTRKWLTKDAAYHAMDFATADSTPKLLLLTNMTNYCAAAHRAIYGQKLAGYCDIWIAKTDGINAQLYKVADENLGGETIAAGGPEGQGVVCFDYGTGRSGLYYIDQGNGNQEAVITPEGNCSELRGDGFSFAWVDQAATGAVKYAYIKQPDVQVTEPGITFSDGNPVEGTALTVSILVRNLTAYNQTGNITVSLYDGDPDAGGVLLAPAQTIGGLAARNDQTVSFTGITTLQEGAHSIYATLSVSTSDPANNNKAYRTINIQDGDTQGPIISNIVVVEHNGDGDGVIGSDEAVRVSWNLTDASGIGTTSATIDGTTVTVQGSYYVDLGPLTAGEHSLVITAIDADRSPESQQKTIKFTVVPCERVFVECNGHVATSGVPIDIGAITLDATDKVAQIIVRNTGEQTLAITGATVSGDASLLESPPSGILAGGLNSLRLLLNTSSLGNHDATVTVTSSALPPQTTFVVKLLYKVGRDQAITFPVLPSTTYGAADFAPGATASSGLVVTYASSNFAVATIVAGKIHIVGAGTATITASQSGNGNWNAAAPVAKTLTVAKKALTATAENKTRSFGTANPAFTIAYAGFANGDTAAVLDAPPTATCSATATSGAGTYPITVSGGNDGNYAFSYVAGTLTIRQDLTITVHFEEPTTVVAAAPATVPVVVHAYSSDTGRPVTSVKLYTAYSFSSTNLIGMATKRTGGSGFFDFAWTNVPVGNYQLFAVATVSSGESGEAFRPPLTVTVTAPVLPTDLMVSALKVTPSKPLDASPFTADVTVRNAGKNPCPGGTLTLTPAVGAAGITQTVPALAKSKSVKMTFTVPGQAPGVKKMTATLSAVPGETKTTNNSRTANYTVTARPDFSITAVAFSPVAPLCNGTFTAYVTIRNNGGTAKAGYLEVWINYADGQAATKSVAVSTISAGKTKRVTVTRLPVGAALGERTFRAVVDGRNTAVESDESNNVFSTTYTPCAVTPTPPPPPPPG
jgi:beta propeller repeat protein